MEKINLYFIRYEELFLQDQTELSDFISSRTNNCVISDNQSCPNTVTLDKSTEQIQDVSVLLGRYRQSLSKYCFTLAYLSDKETNQTIALRTDAVYTSTQIVTIEVLTMLKNLDSVSKLFQVSLPTLPHFERLLTYIISGDCNIFVGEDVSGCVNSVRCTTTEMGINSPLTISSTVENLMIVLVNVPRIVMEADRKSYADNSISGGPSRDVINSIKQQWINFPEIVKQTVELTFELLTVLFTMGSNYTNHRCCSSFDNKLYSIFGLISTTYNLLYLLSRTVSASQRYLVDEMLIDFYLVVGKTFCCTSLMLLAIEQLNCLPQFCR